ncbi:MAG: methyltransferase domain-containing protein [Balneolales bacterium]|nr:methyltransferase domain-containing protein [Balneolales bacterium]
MPLFLHERNTDLTESMDAADCDESLLNNTYSHFKTINRLLSGWDLLFYSYILPHCGERDKEYSLLDIGFGGGDIPAQLLKTAHSYGIRLNITAIDTDARALEYANLHYSDYPIMFLHVSEADLLRQGKKYDFVISNHLMHHLDSSDLKTLVYNSALLCKKALIFNDLSRSDLAWSCFNMLTLFTFRNSFIRYDGLISIRRSYTAEELREILPDFLEVQSFHPFRLVVRYDRNLHPEPEEVAIFAANQPEKALSNV